MQRVHSQNIVLLIVEAHRGKVVSDFAAKARRNCAEQLWQFRMRNHGGIDFKQESRTIPACGGRALNTEIMGMTRLAHD
jgi:hypothetical protein